MYRGYHFTGPDLIMLLVLAFIIIGVLCNWWDDDDDGFGY